MNKTISLITLASIFAGIVIQTKAQSFISSEKNNPSEYISKPITELKTHNNTNFTTNSPSRLDSTYRWLWDTAANAWQVKWKTIFTYDANLNRLSMEDFYWDGSAWRDTLLATFTYDIANNKLSETQQRWSAGNWANTARNFWMYDATNHLDTMHEQLWQFSTWTLRYEHTFSYDVNYNLTQDLRQLWNVTSFVNSART